MEIVLAVLAVLTVVIVTRGVVLIKQAEAMVIERMGKFHRAIYGGLHIILPFVEVVRKLKWRHLAIDVDLQTRVESLELSRIDMRERVLDFPKQNVITKDNIYLSIDALLYFQITDPQRAIYEVENLPLAIEKLTQTTLRNVIGGMEFDECLISRNEINEKLRDVLVDATNKWGVRVGRVEIQDITPPEELKAAMEKQMRAERDRRASILKAEGEKQAAILEAEGKKQAKITEAEGEKEYQVLTAEGKALARIRVAEAEARALEMLRGTIGEKGDATGYLIAIKYLEALREISVGTNSKVVFMPFEATGVLGSLGSMRELLRDVPDSQARKKGEGRAIDAIPGRVEGTSEGAQS